MAEGVDIKDPAVAVHLARIEEKMEGLRLFNNSVSKQIEQLATEVRDIGKISQLYGIHDESVKRIWEEIDKRDQKWDQRFINLDSQHSGTKEKVSRIFWFSAGISSVASIMLAMVLWVVSNEMQKTTRLDARVDAIEIHLAGDQVRPYRPK